jgi:hypothetical protein
MDNEFPASEGGPTSEGLAEAQALFDSARRQLFGVIRDVEGGDAAAVKKLQPLLAELRRATWTIHEERKKHDEERKRELGIVNGYALDLQSARNEIQRRLDCLRPPEDPGGVS